MNATSDPFADFDRLVADSLPSRAAPFTLAEITATPPQRRHLLADAGGESVLVAGKVAILAGKGGTGKTMALLQLAVALATGRPWFGEQGWAPVRPGRSLLLLGEEDREEVLRRLHQVCVALGLSSGELALVTRNVVVLALAGIGVALTHEGEDGGSLPETPRAEEIRAILRNQPFDLVVIDPLSRFAGPDVEKDNAAATRLVQVVETFTAPGCGSPAVIIAHHLRKLGRDEDAESGDLIRGSVALVDGVRWAAVLAQQKALDDELAPDLLRLRVVKSNYTRVPEPLVLCRPKDGRGALRVATATEIANYGSLKGGRSPASVDEVVARLVDALSGIADSDPRGLVTAELRGRLRIGDKPCREAVEVAESRELIKKLGGKRGYRLTDQGRAWLASQGAEP